MLPLGAGLEYKDYYVILAVSPNTDEKTIKQTYPKLDRKYHADMNPRHLVLPENMSEQEVNIFRELAAARKSGQPV